MDDPERARAGRLATRCLVWGAWLIGSAGLLGMVARFGSNVPYWDDWPLVPVLAGDRPVSLAWLWEEANSHRFPVARLLLWVGSRLTQGDLRAGMLLTVLLLCATCALLIRQAAVVRGRTHPSDLVFPLLLLHAGHANVVLWSMSVWFTCASAVVCMLVVLFARGIGDEASTRRMLALVACVLLLPLQGGVGFVATLGVVGGLLAAAVLARSPMRRRLLIGTSLGALALCAAYVVGLADHEKLPAPPSLLEQLRTTLQYATTSLGPAARELWPVSAAFVVVAVLGAFVVLVGSIRRDATRRTCAVTQLGLLVGLLGVSLAIGHARASHGWEAGLAPRYVTPSMPLLVAVHFACLSVGSARVRRLVPSALCLLVLALLPLNTTSGVAWAVDHAAQLAPFEEALRAGVPPEELVERHGLEVSPRRRGLQPLIEQMRRSGKGSYR